MFMRPERVTEERLAPSLGQRDCRYGEGSLLAIVPRRFDQALPTSPFGSPDTREGRVKCHLHFILQIEESRVAQGGANPAGRREADPTNQLPPGHERVEVRVRSHRLTEPLPSRVSHVIGLRFGLALASVQMGREASVAMGM
jgi:hypothetical protein